MSWQFLVTFATIFYSISVVLQRILMKDKQNDPIAFSIIFQLLVGILTGMYACIKGFSLPNLYPFIPNLVLMAVLYGIGNILVFKSLQEIDASEFTIAFASRTLWIVLGALIFLHESFSIIQAIGTLLIVSSIILISWNKKKIKLRSGLWTAIIAAVFMGAAFTNDAFIVSSFDVSSYLTIAFIIPSFLIWIVYPKSTKAMKPLFERNSFIKLCMLAILYAASAISIFLAYQVGKNASQIAPLNQTSTVITVILSMVFLGERSNYSNKIIGAVVSFIGVLLVK